MKRFFETEKEAAFNEKLKWAFTWLMGVCRVVEGDKEGYYMWNKGLRVRKYFRKAIFILPETMPTSPCDDLSISIEDDIAIIELSNAKYMFHLSMILYVWKKLKPVLK